MYMSAANEVGIRALRQNLKATLARVEGGERLTITSHNRPIAQLVPIEKEEDPVRRLIDRGLLTAPSAPFGDFKPLDLEGVSRESLLEALDYVRGDR
jgi:prevent-host-death family protein